MTFPVKNPYKITTYFNKLTHPGIDIAPIPAGSVGVACYAPERSKVIAVGNGKVEGNYIKLQGDSGRYYYMGHFARTFVVNGTIISEGEVIATLGMTGLATGIHTHFEVRTTSNGGQIDPHTINWGTSPGEQDMPADKPTVKRLFNAMYGEEYAANMTEQEIQDWVGTPTNEMVKALIESPQRADYQRKVTDAINNQKTGGGKFKEVGTIDGQPVFKKG